LSNSNPRLLALLAALLLVVGFGGGAVALFHVADRHDAKRAAERARESTTVPSAGLDRQPNGGQPNGAPSGTTATTAKPAPATTATTDEGPAVVLKGDGIGAFIFGADPDQVIAGLTLRWGPPDGDSGWIAAATSPYGACPGMVVRGVNWRGFTVLFSDGATPRGKAGTRHFFTWEYQVSDPAHPRPDEGGNRPPLKTAKGVGVGATVQALKAAYGDALELFDEPPDGTQFGVQTSEGGLFGSVTSLDPGGIVRSIVSGGGCGD
jgi:hypothetical protein